jgi:hypothetical protein
VCPPAERCGDADAEWRWRADAGVTSAPAPAPPPMESMDGEGPGGMSTEREVRWKDAECAGAGAPVTPPALPMLPPGRGWEPARNGETEGSAAGGWGAIAPARFDSMFSRMWVTWDVGKGRACVGARVEGQLRWQ